MNKQIIAIDIDEVLSSQAEVLMAFSKERYGDILTPEHFQEPGEYRDYFQRIWKLPGTEGHDRFKVFLDEKYPLRQIIQSHTLEVLENLKHHFRLEIVTARKGDYQTATLEWVERHAPKLFDGVHFIDLWNQDGEQATKAYVCRQIGAGYLIDDNVEHCQLAQEAGVQALLFGNYGWNNQHDVPLGVVRMKDWHAVQEYFDAIRSRF